MFFITYQNFFGNGPLTEKRRYVTFLHSHDIRVLNVIKVVQTIKMNKQKRNRSLSVTTNHKFWFLSVRPDDPNLGSNDRTLSTKLVDGFNVLKSLTGCVSCVVSYYVHLVISGKFGSFIVSNLFVYNCDDRRIVGIIICKNRSRVSTYIIQRFSNSQNKFQFVFTVYPTTEGLEV